MTYKPFSNRRRKKGSRTRYNKGQQTEQPQNGISRMSRGRWYKAPAVPKEAQSEGRPNTFPTENSFKTNDRFTKNSRTQRQNFFKKNDRYVKKSRTQRQTIKKTASYQAQTGKQLSVPRNSNVRVYSRSRNMGSFEQKESPARSICSESVSSENSTVYSNSCRAKEPVNPQRFPTVTEPYFVPGRTYYTSRPSKVRMRKTFWNDESPVICHLEDATRVFVDRFEVIEKFNSGRFVTRAHITTPVEGWISAYSAPPCGNNSIRATGVLLSRELPKHV